MLGRNEPLLCRNEPPGFTWQTEPPPNRTDFLNKQRNEWREVEDILKKSLSILLITSALDWPID